MKWMITASVLLAATSTVFAQSTAGVVDDFYRERRQMQEQRAIAEHKRESNEAEAARREAYLVELRFSPDASPEAVAVARDYLAAYEPAARSARTRFKHNAKTTSRVLARLEVAARNATIKKHPGLTPAMLDTHLKAYARQLERDRIFGAPKSAAAGAAASRKTD